MSVSYFVRDECLHKVVLILMRKYKIGIIGVGMVGTPLKEYFESKQYRRGKDLFCYDKDPKKKYTDDIFSWRKWRFALAKSRIQEV